MQKHFIGVGGRTKKCTLVNVTQQAVDGLLPEMRADSYAVKTNSTDCHQMFVSASNFCIYTISMHIHG